jgi:hypothetical protein
LYAETSGAGGATGATGPQGPAGQGGVTTAGSGINITGAGTVASPYVVSTIGPPPTVQPRLDAGETPISIYNSFVAQGISSTFAQRTLYGKSYQGGLIAYLNTSDGTGLIAAASDQSTVMQWTLPAYQSLLIGASAQSTTDGSANTDAIIAQTLAAVANTYAAGICRLHSAPGDGGLNDWYLPSKDELNYLWENLADSDGNNSNSGPTDPNNLGGFAYGYYWSSTEIDNYVAWRQSFGNGFQNASGKSNFYYVRAVRAF